MVAVLDWNSGHAHARPLPLPSFHCGCKPGRVEYVAAIMVLQWHSGWVGRIVGDEESPVIVVGSSHTLAKRIYFGPFCFNGAEWQKLMDIDCG